jgi:hypothetical protein
LVDQCGDQSSTKSSAPIVLVGVIQSDTLVRRPVPMRSDPKYPLQLRKLLIAVENVLKGDVKGAMVEVYYFTFASGFNGPQPLGMWSVGNRRIFWVRRDAGVLRTTCDGWDGCTYGVYSGAHPHLNVDPRKPLDKALADIALTRGEGRTDEAKFAGAIDRGGPSSEDYNIVAYRDLALSERFAIREAACIALWYSAGGDRGAEVVGELFSDGRISAAERREMLGLINLAQRAMRDAKCDCRQPEESRGRTALRRGF